MAACMVSAAIGARVSYTASSETLNKNRIQSFPPPPRRLHVAVVRAEGGINPAIRKEEGKVVDSVVLADLSKPLTAYCRCWRSGTFPLCDGSHVKHNKATGDNVGPLLLKKEK